MFKISLIATCVAISCIVFDGLALGHIPFGVAAVSDAEAQDVTGGGGCGYGIQAWDYNCGTDPYCGECGTCSCPEADYENVCTVVSNLAGNYTQTLPGNFYCWYCGQGTCGGTNDAPYFADACGYGS